MRVPGLTCFSTTSLGELKNTIESRNAFSISPTATARTPSEPPIRTRRRCLRVILAASTALCRQSSFETQAFCEVIDPLDLVGMFGKCFLRVSGGAFCLFALAEHGVGAHQPKPAFDIAAVRVQPISELGNHATDHLGALGLRHTLG